MTPSLKRDPLGRLPDGHEVDAIRLDGDRGLAATILTLGATLAALDVPDAAGRRRNIVLGFDRLEDWHRATRRFGSTVGRYANRIGNGCFVLDGVPHHLPVNEPPNTLHGGTQGFDKVVWRIAAFGPEADPWIELLHASPDGDQGFPGRLEVRVRYTLEVDGLRLDYTAATDKATVLNLTNHAYFNLAGAGSGDILGHELQINAAHFTPVDRQLIPTGEIRAVDGTPFDFRKPVAIGARIEHDDEQLALARGYDHNYVLRQSAPDAPVLAARVREPGSERVMEVWTTEPGLQFYSGNFLDGRDIGTEGRAYARRDGFCLETQHFPDSPNQPAFPSTVLRPGEVFRSTTILRFPAV